jgi:hypothetical protein
MVDDRAATEATSDLGPAQCELWQGRRLVTRLADGSMTMAVPTSATELTAAAMPWAAAPWAATP